MSNMSGFLGRVQGWDCSGVSFQSEDQGNICLDYTIESELRSTHLGHCTATVVTVKCTHKFATT